MEVNNLANIKSAIKRAELNVKQNEKNSAQKSAIDKAETKGLIHKNKASRDKARLAAKLG